MKKVLILFLLLGFVSGVNAQVWTSIELGFNSEKTKSTTVIGTEINESEGPKISNLTLAPTIGFDLNENLCVGVVFSMTRYKELEEEAESIDKETSTMSEIDILPFVRYSANVTDDFVVYGQLNVGPKFGKNKFVDIRERFDGTIDTDIDESKISGFGANIHPGVLYKFSDSFSMNAHFGNLGFNSRSEKVEFESTFGGYSKDSSSSFGLDLSMSTLRFGLNIHF